MPFLIQKHANGSQVAQWDLRDKPLSVGRGEEVRVRVEDQKMSRLHFVITPKDGGYVIQDQDSHNGTLVNGRRITETKLKPNDTIHAGQTDFVFAYGLVTMMRELKLDD
jgi:pSer/pThr/pTyr-binding forkhead associated (FHA) protein